MRVVCTRTFACIFSETFIIMLWKSKQNVARCNNDHQYVMFLTKTMKCSRFIRNNDCLRILRIRSYSGPHFFRIFSHSDWIRRDTEWIRSISLYSVRMRENAEKMWTRVTPNANTFYAVNFLFAYTENKFYRRSTPLE